MQERDTLASALSIHRHSAFRFQQGTQQGHSAASSPFSRPLDVASRQRRSEFVPEAPWKTLLTRQMTELANGRLRMDLHPTGSFPVCALARLPHLGGFWSLVRQRTVTGACSFSFLSDDAVTGPRPLRLHSGPLDRASHGDAAVCHRGSRKKTCRAATVPEPAAPIADRHVRTQAARCCEPTRRRRWRRPTSSLSERSERTE